MRVFVVEKEALADAYLFCFGSWVLVAGGSDNKNVWVGFWWSMVWQSYSEQ
jgi:hypothetical protein